MPTIAGALNRLYGWACEVLYHQAACSYDIVSNVVSGGRWSRWRRMILPYLDQGPVLELGFGPGHLLREGRESGLQMFGVDRSPQMAARARLPGQTNSPRGYICVANAQQLPFASAAFGTVAATFPAPFILERTTLAECHRVLQANGRLVVLGIWVEVHAGPGRYLPVFYGRPSADRLDAITQQVAQAGFAAQPLSVADAPFVVGGIVARKLDGSHS